MSPSQSEAPVDDKKARKAARKLELATLRAERAERVAAKDARLFSEACEAARALEADPFSLERLADVRFRVGAARHVRFTTPDGESFFVLTEVLNRLRRTRRYIERRGGFVFYDKALRIRWNREVGTARGGLSLRDSTISSNGKPLRKKGDSATCALFIEVHIPRFEA